jgi:hypothetical protein
MCHATHAATIVVKNLSSDFLPHHFVLPQRPVNRIKSEGIEKRERKDIIIFEQLLPFVKYFCVLFYCAQVILRLGK